LEVYLGVLVSDMRQQQIILRECLNDENLQTIALSALALGWVKPSKAILTMLRKINPVTFPGRYAQQILADEKTPSKTPSAFKCAV